MEHLLAGIIDKIPTHFKSKIGQSVISGLPKIQKKVFRGHQKGKSSLEIAKELGYKMVSDAGYSAVQKRLYQSLIPIVLSAKGSNDIAKTKIDLYRQFVMVKIFRIMTLRHHAHKLSEKIIKPLRKYQMWQEVMQLAGWLSYHYMIYEGDNKMSNYYREVALEAHSIVGKEMEIEYKFGVLYRQVKDGKTNVDFNNIANAFEYDIDLDSTTYQNYFFLVKFTQYWQHKQYDKCVEIADQTLQYFEDLPYSHANAINHILGHKLQAMEMQGRLINAEGVLQSLMNSTTISDNNHYEYNEYYLKLLMLELRFKEAESMFKTLQRYSKIKGCPLAENRMLLYKLYIDFALGKPTKYQSAVNRMNKVKESDNIKVPLHVIRVCYTFFYDRDRFIDQTDALLKHTERHLKKHPRQKLFYNALIAYSKYQDFDTSLLHGALSYEELIPYQSLLKLSRGESLEAA